MAFMAKDKIVRTGDDLNLATLVGLQADATALGLLADTAIGPTQTGVAMVAANRLVKVARVALGLGDSIFSWQNPEAGSILVSRILVDVTTQSTGACSIDIGTTATTATTSSDNLIDGLSVATAGVSDNMLAATLGTNGKTAQKLASAKWVTGTKVAGGNTAGLVGFVYIHYILI